MAQADQIDLPWADTELPNSWENNDERGHTETILHLLIYQVLP